MQGEIFGLLLNDRGQGGYLENAVKTHLCAMLGKFSASQHGACHARNVVRSHLCSQQAVITANACFGRFYSSAEIKVDYIKGKNLLVSFFCAQEVWGLRKLKFFELFLWRFSLCMHHYKISKHFQK